MLIPNLLTPTGSTLLAGPPLAFQQYIAREIIAAATMDGGHVLYLQDSINDGLDAVRAFGNWEALRQRKSKGPQLDAISFHDIRSVQDCANAINSAFPGAAGPRIVCRDVSRSLAIMVPTDTWPTWLPLLARLAPAQYLTVTHTGIRGAAVTDNKKPFTATWTLADDHDPPPVQRYGERFRLSEIPNGRVIKLQGQSYPSDLLFDLYEPKKELAL